MPEKSELIQQLFRQEFSKMVSVISSLYGLQYIEISEDIVSETFLQAKENWDAKEIPPNPTAWLYTVAKQKTLYHFRREKIYTTKVIPEFKRNAQVEVEAPELDFSEQNIQDSQLRMMFAVCTPLIASEAQIGLALRVLCGFGIDEIAEAFLSNKESINKRLYRAKQKLRNEKVNLELPIDEEIETRLDNVLHVIYLLFNEGYYSSAENHILRKDLCLEAIRLGIILAECDKTNRPKTNALLALMCFHTSRFEARLNSDNEIILYENQNKNIWNKALINQGVRFLDISASGNGISSYHLEAGIAFWNCQKKDTKEKWENILYHYNLLIKINPSPSVALNRLYALYKVEGKSKAIIQAEKLQGIDSHFYFTLLGELNQGIDNDKAKSNFQKALSMAKKPTDKKIIKSKIDNL